MQLKAAERAPFFPIEPSVDDEGWPERNIYWSAEGKRERRAVRQRATRPLVICGHGVSLKVEAGALLVRSGFTHYPQQREALRFFKGDLNLPPRIIMLDGSGSLSFAVLSWLSEQNVPLISIDFQGEVVTVIGGSGSAFVPDRVAWQVETRADPEKRLAFCCGLIAKKVLASIDTLSVAIPPSAARETAIARAQDAITRLRAVAVRNVNDILLIEARAAAAYFTSWRTLPLRWKAKAKHPTPAAWDVAGSRRTVRDSRFATNRNATHPINAMLNYAYGVLHSQVQINAVALGYDPKQGIMHESRPDAQALILDLMEPHRPAVDAAVLKFITANTFSGADFVLRSDGICRLVPQLARRLCEALPVLDQPAAFSAA